MRTEWPCTCRGIDLGPVSLDVGARNETRIERTSNDGTDDCRGICPELEEVAESGSDSLALSKSSWEVGPRCIGVALLCQCMIHAERCKTVYLLDVVLERPRQTKVSRSLAQLHCY